MRLFFFSFFNRDVSSSVSSVGGSRQAAISILGQVGLSLFGYATSGALRLGVPLAGSSWIRLLS